MSFPTCLIYTDYSHFQAFSLLFCRYWASVLFPTFAVALIYADYSHTREWKLNKKSLEQQEQKNLQ